MKLLRSLLIALVLGISFGSMTGCYFDDMAVEPVVVYRSGFGYGYWHDSYWYAAPMGYRYYNGARPYWGPRYYRPGYSHGPYAPRPYSGGYRGGFGHGGGFHGGHR